MTAPELDDETTWLDDLAALLAAAGLGTWSAHGTYPDDAEWPIFLERTPAEPDRCVVLTGYSGDESTVDDEPRVQIKVRGDTDPRTSRNQAQAIYRHLDGLVGGTPLGEHRWLVHAPGINGGPISLGIDGNRRHLHVTNHRTTISERQ